MNTEDKDNAITPDYIDTLINQIASRNTAKSNSAYYDLQDIVEDVAEAYLKLHEENARLKQKLLDERGCDVDGCEVHIRAFSEENTRLRKVIEFYASHDNYNDGKPMITTITDIPEGEKISTWCITFTGSFTFSNWDNGATAREALSLTATEKDVE